jgi:hypothetical protein
MRREQIDKRAQVQRAESRQAPAVAPGKATPASKLAGRRGQPSTPGAVQMRPASGSSSLDADMDAAHRGVQASLDAGATTGAPPEGTMEGTIDAKEGDAPAAPASAFDTAKANHKKNLDHLHKMIQDGKKAKPGDTRFGIAWPNSCEWLDAGRTMLHALTETHDSTARATALGSPGKRAMFGIDTAVPGESDYNETTQTDARNIYSAQPTWLGFRRSGSPSKVVIIEPAKKTTDLVQETIVHEVHHDADRHGTADFERYATEFRAYWLDGTYRAEDATPGSANDSQTAADGTVLAGFDSARQQRIFRHLFESSSYPYVKDGWLNDADFKKQVLAMKVPTGHNTINSVRLDDMYKAVQGFGTDEDAFHAAVAKLTPEEKAAIRSDSMRATWLALIDGDFSTVEAAQIKKALGLV